jgi:hypothetical protein
MSTSNWVHPVDEQCFHCASDETLAWGIDLYDRGEVWDGPTVHMQIPESACPHFTADVD